MPNPDLAAIKARQVKGFRGAWGLVRDETLECGAQFVIKESKSGTTLMHIRWAEEADWILHARTDLPALLKRVRELEAENASLRFDLGERYPGFYHLGKMAEKYTDVCLSKDADGWQLELSGRLPHDSGWASFAYPTPAQAVNAGQWTVPIKEAKCLTRNNPSPS